MLNKTGSDASTQEKIEHIELSKTIINNQMRMINQLKEKLQEVEKTEESASDDETTSESEIVPKVKNDKK